MKHLLTLMIGSCIFVAANAQIRFVEVNYTTDEFAIKNFGTNTVDISNYRLCGLFVYTTNLTSLSVLSGSLTLGAQDTVVLTGFNLGAQSDFNLYLPGFSSIDFADENFMTDFVQWGSGGNGRESVAVLKGIWTAGDFLTSATPYQYTGNGNQNGLSFWQTIPTPPVGFSNDFSLEDMDIDIYPNPVNDHFTLSVNYAALKNLDNISLVLHDMLGREVKRIGSIAADKTIVTRSNLPAGVYVLSIMNGRELLAKRKILLN